MQIIIKPFFLLLTLLFFTQCGKESSSQKSVNEKIKRVSVTTPETIVSPAAKEELIPVFDTFDRSIQIARLQEKINNGQPLIAHILVPLCDNEHQGIVPVNARLGDGMNLQTNLYWGARYGMKAHFKRLLDWKLVSTEKNIRPDILERVVFFKKYSNGAKVYLVADAYRGDRMLNCLNTYFATLGGHSEDKVIFPETYEAEQQISIASAADLIGFNGHNGLMDYTITLPKGSKQLKRDAVVIGCASHSYFEPHLKVSWAYPLVTTSNLLAPEAYVMEAIINNWAALEKEEAIRLRAGDAYHKYQGCGQKGARRLFKSGWDKK